MRRLVLYLIILLSLKNSMVVKADDGGLNVKTDSITRYKQKSSGNAIEREYAPNLFLDKAAQEVTKAKTTDEKALSQAKTVLFNGVSNNNYSLDLKSYTTHLFEDYSVDDTIMTSTSDETESIVWKIVACIGFIAVMCGSGIWLGRKWHGRRLR